VAEEPDMMLETIATLEDVLARGFDIVDVIVQDEYTHDVVARRGETIVVFDTT
jgi:hypothetical protein